MKFADLELRFLSNFEKLNTTIDAINKRLDQAEKHTKQTGKQAEDSANRISAAIAKIGKAAALATAAISGVVVAAVAVKNTILSFDEAAERIDNLGKVAKQLQVPIEQLSVLRFAAGESGVEFETLSKMAAKASKNLAEMLSEGKTVLPLGRMNVNLTDSAGRLRSITDLLPEIATGLEGLGSAGQKIDLASKIFGKEGGAEFVKFLADGGNFIENMAVQTDRARRLGVIFTDEQVKKLTAYKDAVGRVEEAWLGLKVSLMTEISPVLTEVADRLALQMGGLPGQIRAAGTAWRIANSDIPVISEIAQDELDRLTDRMSSTFLTTMSETGRVLGTVFLETVSTGMAVLGPPLEDLLRDHVGPMLNAIPGVNIEKSLSGKRQDALNEYLFAKTQRDDLVDRHTKLADMLGEVDGFTQLDFIARMAAIEVELNKHEGTAEEHLKRLGDLDKLVKAEAAARNKMILQIFDGSMEATAAAMARANERITAEWDALQEQQDRILEAYGPTQASGTAAGPTGSFPILEVFDSLGDGWDALTARLERVEPKLGQVTDKLMARVAAIQDFRSDLGRRSQMATAGMSGADTDRIRMLANFEDQVQALVQKLGPDSQLISELRAVQDLELEVFDAEKIARANKEVEQWVMNLRRSVDPASDLKLEMEKVNQAFLVGTIDADLYNKVIEDIMRKLKELGEKNESIAAKMGKAIEGFSDDATRALADFAFEGKGSLEDLLLSFERMMFETLTKAAIFDPLFKQLGSAFGGSDGFLANVFGGIFGGAKAHGDAFINGDVVPFASGGVVNGPTLFPMSGRRTGLMGEAGPEAIMPLQRIGGDLGVRATGGGVTVQIIDQRGSGERPQVSESTGPDGRRMIQVLIRDQVKTAFSEGSMDTLMGRMYGLRRAGT